MKIQQNVDWLLWPYVRRRWVFVALMLACFLGIAASALLHPVWCMIVCDAAALVLAIATLDSRWRYVMWRDASSRTTRWRARS